MAAILIAVLIPCIYSWRYYKRQLQSGKVEKKPVSQKALIRGSIFAAVILSLIHIYIYDITKWNGYIHKMEYINNPPEGL